MTEPSRLVRGFLTAVALSSRLSAQDTDPALQARLDEVAARSGGILGVFAKDLGNGRTASVHASERFPMASTYKIPIAVTVLDAVDHGRLRLDQPIEIGKQDLAPGFSPIVEEWNPGETRTIESLLRSMLVESDNTASDVLMKVAGGPAAVTGRLRALGIAAMDVNRSEAQMAADFHGTTLPARRDIETLTDHFRDAPEKTREAGALRFGRDPRDTTTPLAMGSLLERIVAGRVASPPRVTLLRRLMAESRSPGPRFDSAVPAGTVLERKTGTCPTGFGFNCFNDVGILTLPGSRNPIILVAYLKASTKSEAERNAALGDVARAVVETWGR